MKPFIATALAVFFHVVGFAVGAGIWVAIGYGIGLAIGAPISAALTGLAWQLGCYFVVHDQMAQALDRSRQKFLTVLDRAFA